MYASVCLLASFHVVGCHAPGLIQDKQLESPKKIPSGVYEVLRDSLKENELLPLAAGEVMAVNRYRFLKDGEKESPRYVVIRSAPDVELTLAEEPKADMDGDDVVRILLKLQPKAATALERLTTDRAGKQIAIVLDGEIVTMHKIRAAIKGGEVQITSCAEGGAKYLLQKLQAQQKKPR
jgi:preprotein translocase subunit SecD